MHQLLILTEQQRLQLPAAASATQSKLRTTKSNLLASGKQRGAGNNEALMDSGLVAWWTFEDGPNLSSKEIRVEDITGKRFKTLVQRGNKNVVVTSKKKVVNKQTEQGNDDVAGKSGHNTSTSELKQAVSGKRKAPKAPIEYEYSHYDISQEVLNEISFLIVSRPQPSSSASSPASPSLSKHSYHVPSEDLNRSRHTDKEEKVNYFDVKASEEKGDIYSNLYEINQRLIRSIEMAMWLDADSLPQKVPVSLSKKADSEEASLASEIRSTHSDSKTAVVSGDFGGSKGSVVKSLLPLPSYRQRHQCPYEVRRKH